MKATEVNSIVRDTYFKTLREVIKEAISFRGSYCEEHDSMIHLKASFTY